MLGKEYKLDELEVPEENELEEYELNEKEELKEEIERRIIISLEYWLAKKLIDPDKETEKMGDEDNLIYDRDYAFIEEEDSETIEDTIEKELETHNNVIEYYMENIPVPAKNPKTKKPTDSDKKEIIDNIYATMKPIIMENLKALTKEEENEIKKEVIEEVFKDFEMF